MDAHNECLLQVFGGVFETFLKHELLSLICLYFRKFRLDMTKITNHSQNNKPWQKNRQGILFCCRICLFSTAVDIPGTGVGSRWLECLAPKLLVSLFSGSMLPWLHIFMSALTHSDQVFSGLPLSATRNHHTCDGVCA